MPNTLPKHGRGSMSLRAQLQVTAEGRALPPGQAHNRARRDEKAFQINAPAMHQALHLEEKRLAKLTRHQRLLEKLGPEGIRKARLAQMTLLERLKNATKRQAPNRAARRR